MKEGCWVVNTNYGSFVTDTKDFIGHTIYNDHVWEPEIIKVYKTLLQPHYIVLDIGAHMGFHTINLAFYSKHVYAFEPQLPIHNQLCGNVFLNGLDNKITCYNVGLGEKDKKSSFGDLYEHNSLNWGWDTEIINYGGRALEDDLGINDIEIKTLDSYNLSPHFIKMDVEGYELKTLQGAINTITTYYPTILLETLPEHQDEVFKFLKDIGYETFRVPDTYLGFDFISIHPNFEDYVSIKEKLFSELNVVI
jgi:FkbM family methyltransferase